MATSGVRLRDLLFPLLLMACGVLGLAVVTRIGLQAPAPRSTRGRAAQEAAPSNEAPAASGALAGPRVQSLGDSAGRPEPRARPPR